MNTEKSIPEIINYKKNVASRLIPITGNQIGEIIQKSEEYIFSEKLDGYLCLVFKNERGLLFFDQSGTKLKLDHLVKEFPVNAYGMWAGELYVSEGRSRSFLVSSALSKNSEILKLAIFDYISNENISKSERIKKVQEVFNENGLVHKVYFQKSNSRSDLIDAFQTISENSGEGLVVHTSSGIGYKIKPLLSIDCVVLGYALKENKSQIRELLVGLKTENGIVIAGKVGNGFSENDRVDWIKLLEPLVVDSNCLEVAGNGLAFKWIKPEIIIEINCNEVIFENSSGHIIKPEVVFEDGSYKKLKNMVSISFISPVFSQFRKDKKPIISDVGFNQIEGYEINDNIVIHNIESNDAIILKRNVYVKEGKSGKAVRKITLLENDKANKDKSPYVVFFTDLSLGRKDPLQTEIYISSDLENAKKMYDQVIEENIKKGWEEV